jgi:glycosyltransferase involved in cell wall biosynthesis
MPTLLRAIEQLKATPDLFLLTLGRGHLMNSPVPNVALGPISDEERLSLAYNAADLLLLPSVQENFPNTALEALACGLPVIGSRVGGVPEIVREDCTGSLVEVGNADALAGAIKELLGTPDRLREMSIKWRRVAVEEYSLEIQARRYAELYASLLQPSASS